DLLDRVSIGFLRKPGEDRRLTGRILTATRIQNVPHDDLVKIDGGQGTVIRIVLLLDIRHVELAEYGRPGRLDVVGYGRTQPGPDNGLLDDQPAHFHHRYA